MIQSRRQALISLRRADLESVQGSEEGKSSPSSSPTFLHHQQKKGLQSRFIRAFSPGSGTGTKGSVLMPIPLVPVQSRTGTKGGLKGAATWSSTFSPGNFMIIFEIFLKFFLIFKFLNYFNFQSVITTPHHFSIYPLITPHHSKSSNFPNGHRYSQSPSLSTLNFRVLFSLVSKSALVVFLTIVRCQSY